MTREKGTYRAQSERKFQQPDHCGADQITDNDSVFLCHCAASFSASENFSQKSPSPDSRMISANTS